MSLNGLTDTSGSFQNKPHGSIAIAADGYKELQGYTDAQFLIDKRLISDWKGVIMVAGLMGAGKTTLMGGLVQEIPEIILIQSQKTRLPRPGEVIGNNVIPAGDYHIITELLPSGEYRFHIPVDKTVVAEISVGVNAVRKKFARSILLWLNTDFATAMEQASVRDRSLEKFIDRISNLGNYQVVSEKANIFVPGTLPNNLVTRLAIRKLAESIRGEET